MKMPALIALLALPAVSAPLTQDERDRAMSELHATRKQFLDAVEGLSAAQWNFKPAPGAWSIAEIAEHLALSEAALPGAVRGILATPAQPERRGGTRDKDETVLRVLADRSTKVQAPAGLTPTRRWPPREIVQRFRRDRDANIAYVRTTGDDLRAHFQEAPGLGLLDAYQWILIEPGHVARHLQQIAEVKANPRYPGR